MVTERSLFSLQPDRLGPALRYRTLPDDRVRPETDVTLQLQKPRPGARALCTGVDFVDSANYALQHEPVSRCAIRQPVD